MNQGAPPPDVSVVIVNYNTPDLTRACVRSVLAHTRSIQVEIIVVDNGSREVQPLRELRLEDDRVQLLESKENLGFAGGNNLGISTAGGAYILLLNSDTVLANDAISIALEEARGDKTIGVVSAKLRYPDGRVQYACRRFPSIALELLEASRLHRLLPRRHRARYMQGSYFDHQTRLETDAIWGAFFLFPREVLQVFPSGRLSETFFMYGEDMEWCWVIRKHGYKVVYQPAADVIHYLGGSGFQSQVGGPGGTIYRHRIQFLRLYRGSAYALCYALARYWNVLLSRGPGRAAEVQIARTMFGALRETPIATRTV